MMRIPAMSNPRPSAAGATQGTQGGTSGPRPAGRVPGGRSLALGDEMYLWILVAIEIGLLAYGRKLFRRHHGG